MDGWMDYHVWNKLILLGYSNQGEEFHSLELLQERIVNSQPFLSQGIVVGLAFKH
jgi:hypothetical protein